jgi:hypothetical protein
MQTDVDKPEAQLPPDYNLALPVLCGSGVGMEWALAASSTSGFQVSRVSRQVDILDSTC